MARLAVILENGVVSDVLTDSGTPLTVEILDICEDYQDYEELEQYRCTLYSDSTLRHTDYQVVNFEEENHK